MPQSWYIITWTTHGSWLPGDSRGFRTRRQKRSIPAPKRYTDGKYPYNAQDWHDLLEYSRRITRGHIQLDNRQREFLRQKLAMIATDCGCPAKAIQVESTHIHMLVKLDGAGLPKLVNRLKGASSHSLSEYGLPGKVWARGYHMRVIPDKALPEALQYLNRHAKQGFKPKPRPSGRG